MVTGMRVLGVDPGLTRCGVGVIDGAPGRPLTMAAAGVIMTPPDHDVARRLLALEAGLEEWLDAYRPDAVAVERVFSQHNVRTVMGTAQAGAVAIVCAARRGLPVALHTPSEVKAAVTGSGRADKAQVTADALALAICHLWRGGAQRRLAEAAALAAQCQAARGRPDSGGPSPSGAARHTGGMA
jgi:crossover junction endodeoxyribonuclease RuvC